MTRTVYKRGSVRVTLDHQTASFIAYSGGWTAFSNVFEHGLSTPLGGHLPPDAREGTVQIQVKMKRYTTVCRGHFYAAVAVVVVPAHLAYAAVSIGDDGDAS